MTYFLFPEKLFVFFCLHPPQRPLSSGPAAERERERETLRWKEKPRESEEEEMQGDKRVGEQSERWSGERIDVGLSFSPSEAETVRR